MDIKKIEKLLLVRPSLERTVRCLFFGLVFLFPVIIALDVFIFWKYYQTAVEKPDAAAIRSVAVSRGDFSRALDVIKKREFFESR